MPYLLKILLLIHIKETREKKKKEKKKEFTIIGKKQSLSLVAEHNLEIQNNINDWIVHTKTIAAFVVMNE